MVEEAYYDYYSVIVDSLRRQHEIDLAIYRAAHTEWHNRVVHWILIPVETASFLFGCSAILDTTGSSQSKIFPIIGWFLGLLSLLLAGPNHVMIGLAACLFHVVIGTVSTRLSGAKQKKVLLIVTITIVWTIAWSLQVGVGHNLLEGNQPNLIANMQQVSYLSMATSVLVAWKS